MPDDATLNTDAISESRKRSNANLQPWQPGQSGNPRGRPKKIIEPLLRKLAQSDPDGKGVIAERLALKLVQMALRGNVKAMSMLLDRYDGKVADVVEGGDEKRPLRLIIENGNGNGNGNGKPEEEG